MPVTPSLGLADDAQLAVLDVRGERRVRGRALGARAVGEDAGLAAAEAHRVGLAAAVDLDVEPRGERVDHRGADAVQAAGGGVGAAAELAAGVQLGEDHLDAGQPGARLDVDRDAAAVVAHLDRAVAVQDDLDAVAVAGEGLVDGVVDDLPEAVHEAAASRSSRCTCPGACAPPRAPRGPAGGGRCSRRRRRPGGAWWCWWRRPRTSLRHGVRPAVARAGSPDAG